MTSLLERRTRVAGNNRAHHPNEKASIQEMVEYLRKSAGGVKSLLSPRSGGSPTAKQTLRVETQFIGRLQWRSHAVKVAVLKVHCEILIGGSMLLVSCSPIAMALHAAHLSAEFDLSLIRLSYLSQISITAISSGERVRTLVLLYFEGPDRLSHPDESEIQTSFIVSEVLHFRFQNSSWSFCWPVAERPMTVLRSGQIGRGLLRRH
jgi:hypothetical protein